LNPESGHYRGDRCAFFKVKNCNICWQTDQWNMILRHRVLKTMIRILGVEVDKPLKDLPTPMSERDKCGSTTLVHQSFWLIKHRFSNRQGNIPPDTNVLSQVWNISQEYNNECISEYCGHYFCSGFLSLWPFSVTAHWCGHVTNIQGPTSPHRRPVVNPRSYAKVGILLAWQLAWYVTESSQITHLGRNSGRNVSKNTWVCTCVFACIERSSWLDPCRDHGDEVTLNNNCGKVLHDDIACPNMGSATWLHT
jgi:hypothetical protein